MRSLLDALGWWWRDGPAFPTLADYDLSLRFDPLVDYAQASMRPIVPPLDQTGKPDTWKYLGDPAVWLPVCIAWQYQTVKDSAGVTLYERIRELFYNVGRCAGLGFYETEWAHAAYRFVLGDADTIYRLSRAWNQYPGTQHGSVYFATFPGHRDIYTGSATKPEQGRKPLSPVNAVRIPGHAWWYSVGWPEQGQQRGAPPEAMANANMSGPIRYPSTASNMLTHGLAGFSARPSWNEVAWLQNWAARYNRHRSGPWLWRQEAGL